VTGPNVYDGCPLKLESKFASQQAGRGKAQTGLGPIDSDVCLWSASLSFARFIRILLNMLANTLR
jgi:hypothetical protein